MQPLISHAEDLLVDALRAQGVRVTRQVHVPTASGDRDYLLDLAIVDARVDIEVDGPHHGTPLQRAKDDHRDAWLRRHGWKVIRIPADTIHADPTLAATKLIRLLGRHGHTGAQGWLLMTLRRAWWNRPSLLLASVALSYATWRLIAHIDTSWVRIIALCASALAALFAIRVPRVDYGRRFVGGYSRRRSKPFGFLSDIAIILFALAAALFALVWVA